MPLLDRPDARIHYETYGEGDPVLFVMGLGADSEGWAEQVRAVAPRRRAIVLDNRGVGRSSRSRRFDYSIAATAADAAALLDYLGVGPAHVVGISLGGVVAQRLAIETPARVRSLVLAATFAKPDPGLLGRSAAMGARMIRWLADPRPAEEGRMARAVLRAWMPDMLSPSFRRDNEAMVTSIIANAVGRGVRVEVDLLQLAAVLRHDARVALESVMTPALVLAGTTDTVVPLSIVQELARTLPRARLEMLDGSHGLNLEARDAFNRAMLRFFDEVESA